MFVSDADNDWMVVSYYLRVMTTTTTTTQIVATMRQKQKQHCYS
jgi:hypothetical protein